MGVRLFTAPPIQPRARANWIMRNRHELIEARADALYDTMYNALKPVLKFASLPDKAAHHLQEVALVLASEDVARHRFPEEEPL